MGPSLIIALGTLLLLAGCKPGHHGGLGPHEESVKGSHFIERIRRAREPVSYSVSSEPLLQGKTTVPGESFATLERLMRLKKYPCSECHKVGPPRSDGKNKKAHWDILLEHANEKVLYCQTCHDPDNPGELHLLRGERVDINHGYEVCAQCHQRQFEDWKGGAHGKRAGGWAPPRVLYTCMECHNPHSPKIKARWPVSLNKPVRKH